MKKLTKKEVRRGLESFIYAIAMGSYDIYPELLKSMAEFHICRTHAVGLTEHLCKPEWKERHSMVFNPVEVNTREVFPVDNLMPTL